MNKKYISDVITTEDMNNWGDGEVVTVKSPTGKGKSHFIKHKLYSFAKRQGKKILMLIHRASCVNQFQMEIERDNKTDVITIITYQKLDHMLKNKYQFNLDQYSYFVCDEIQYGLDDSPFNRYTDLGIDELLKQNDKVRIFMSATGDDMFKYIKNYRKHKTTDYVLPDDYRHISSLTFYNKNESLEKIMRQCVDENRKTIFFIQSASQAYNLHKKFKKHSMFVCSQSNKEYSKYIDQEKLTNMLVNERFEDLMLICTTALDSGINLKDRDLKYIVIDVKSENSLIQCLGRKRIIDENDTVDVLIKSISNQQLGGMITQLNTRRQMARFLKRYGLEAYLEEYKRDSDRFGIVYDVYAEKETCRKEINHMMFFKALLESNEIEMMISNYGKYAYNKHLARKLKKFDNETGDYNYNMLVEDSTEELEDYLNGIVGKKLFKDEQKELKEVFVKNDLKTRTLGINTMNGNLKDRKLAFMIVSKRSSKMIDGKKKDYRYWEVINNVELRTN